MLDYLRNRRASPAEKRQEMLNAYLDNALTAAERERFERQLAGDAALRDEMERLRTLKIQMRSMPRRRVPRSFALDPALYGRPKPQPLMRAYPVLRGATALTALLLIFTLALGMFQGGSFGQTADSAPAAEIITMSEMPVEEPAMSPESAHMAAPDAREALDGARPTVEVALEESAELFATEALTDSFTLEAAPVPPASPAPEEDMAAAGMPETELSPQLEMETADTAEPEVAESGMPANPVEEEVTEATGGRAFGNFLGPLQITLLIVFLLLLALLLIARRQVRSF